MAAAWINLVATDLEDYLVAAQVSAMRTAALGDSQGDPFDKVMPDVVRDMRRKIESCPRNVLSATADSIPPELKKAACYLIIEALEGRLKLKVTEDQRKQIDKAEKQMERIADCKEVVTAPLDPEEHQGQQSGGVTVVNSTCREASRERLNGI